MSAKADAIRLVRREDHAQRLRAKVPDFDTMDPSIDMSLRCHQCGTQVEAVAEFPAIRDPEFDDEHPRICLACLGQAVVLLATWREGPSS